MQSTKFWSIGNGRRIFGQLFAHDRLLFAETKEVLQAMIDALVAYYTETRRRINTSKCEIIVMRDFDVGAVTGVSIGEETIPEKQTVRYLGAFFGVHGILPGSPQMRHAGWKPAQSATACSWR